MATDETQSYMASLLPVSLHNNFLYTTYNDYKNQTGGLTAYQIECYDRSPTAPSCLVLRYDNQTSYLALTNYTCTQSVPGLVLSNGTTYYNVSQEFFREQLKTSPDLLYQDFMLNDWIIIGGIEISANYKLPHAKAGNGGYNWNENALCLNNLALGSNNWTVEWWQKVEAYTKDWSEFSEDSARPAYLTLAGDSYNKIFTCSADIYWCDDATYQDFYAEGFKNGTVLFMGDVSQSGYCYTHLLQCYMADGNWSYYCFMNDSTNKKQYFFRNGVLQAINEQGIDMGSTLTYVRIGYDLSGLGINQFQPCMQNGALDMFRISASLKYDVSGFEIPGTGSTPLYSVEPDTKSYMAFTVY